MPQLRVNQSIMQSLPQRELKQLFELCPFGAIEIHKDKVDINAACRMCRICVKNGPAGLFEYLEESAGDDLSGWRGIAVYIEDKPEAGPHPVSSELIGKALELSAGKDCPVYALYIGKDQTAAEKLAKTCGVSRFYAYCHPSLERFQIEPYTNIFEMFIKDVKPASVLVGATPAGRSLAPKLAARFGTGLTADCTALEMKDNGELVQIRPAFGGNVMARIITPKHRPQMATVRYRVFDPPKACAGKTEVVSVTVPEDMLKSRIKSVEVIKKERKPDIADAEVIVVCGRAFKSAGDLDMAYTLAGLLGGEVAGTRPLIEKGWFEPTRQIGLSGRTVKPKLIVTLGVSGAVQFKAGMENAANIVAVNTDRTAPIMNICHHALIGDIYEIVPRLIDNLKKREANLV